MAIGDTTAPTGGVPSLTADEITSLYLKYLGRPPEGNELASELENANKYSAAGIERQIANRASNVAGSGIRGDEGLPSLTQPAPVASAVTAGPSTPSASTPPTVGPTGLANPIAPINYATMQTGAQYGYTPRSGGGGTTFVPAGGGGGGLFGGGIMTWLVVGGVAFGAWYLLKK